MNRPIGYVIVCPCEPSANFQFHELIAWTTTAMSAVSSLRGSLRQYLTLLFTLDNAKSGLFYYVLLTQVVKAHRHLRARGITSSVNDIYTWISQVRTAAAQTLDMDLLNAPPLANYIFNSAHAINASQGYCSNGAGKA